MRPRLTLGVRREDRIDEVRGRSVNDKCEDEVERQRVAFGPDRHFVAPLCRTHRRIRFVALLRRTASSDSLCGHTCAVVRDLDLALAEGEGQGIEFKVG